MFACKDEHFCSDFSSLFHIFMHILFIYLLFIYLFIYLKSRLGPILGSVGFPQYNFCFFCLIFFHSDGSRLCVAMLSVEYLSLTLYVLTKTLGMHIYMYMCVVFSHRKYNVLKSVQFVHHWAFISFCFCWIVLFSRNFFTEKKTKNNAWRRLRGRSWNFDWIFCGAFAVYLLKTCIYWKSENGNILQNNI